VHDLSAVGTTGRREAEACDAAVSDRAFRRRGGLPVGVPRGGHLWVIERFSKVDAIDLAENN